MGAMAFMPVWGNRRIFADLPTRALSFLHAAVPAGVAHGCLGDLGRFADHDRTFHGEDAAVRFPVQRQHIRGGFAQQRDAVIEGGQRRMRA